MNSRGLVTRQVLIEEVLDAHAPLLGRDFSGYRGHVYRTFNYACAFAGYPADPSELAVAAVFHDLGIWSSNTFDYVEPSSRAALAYARSRFPALDQTALRTIIESHHKLRPCRGHAAAEALRRADLADLSFGLIRFGLSSGLVADVRRAFPNAGFHACLWRIGWRWALRHPLRPLPMLRW